ncbi:MAG: pseudaminic acid synthase [Alphaproteobacteria bacterium]
MGPYASKLGEMAIAGRRVGAGAAPFVVAEMSANHLGRLDRAIAIMVAAKAAGADAVKLQSYSADALTIDHDGPGFVFEGGPWHGRKLHALYRAAAMPWDWHPALFAKGRELGITVFSTPFDAAGVDRLVALGAPAYKIASFELIDHALVRRVAATGKPVILSTGMASDEEINEAVAAARSAGARELALLHCVSAYPTPPEDSNLATIPALARRHGTVVGLSDHTLGTAVAVAAVALGAVMVEKHVTLARADGGPDAAFSLEPGELARLVADCRAAHLAIGIVRERPAPSEAGMRAYRRSLYVVADVRAGERISGVNVRSIRPGHGLAPKHLDAVLGRRATRDLARGTPLAWDMIGD